MDYRKLIKEEIAKLHTAKGVKVNPKLDSDLGEQIVADICRKVVKNCSIPAVSNSEVFEHYGKPFTSGRDLWDFLTAHYNFTPKT